MSPRKLVNSRRVESHLTAICRKPPSKVRMCEAGAGLR